MPYLMNRSSFLSPFLFLVLGILFALPSFSYSEWSRFRGENGSGVNVGAEIPSALSDDNKAWSVDVPGQGHGSPVVAGGRIYLLSAVEVEADVPGENQKGGKKKGKGNAPKPYRWLTLCLDAETGKTIWEKDFPQRKFKGHRYNSAASSTAAVDEDQVVFAWGTADQLTVVSLDLEGNLQWEQNLGPVVGGHGFGGSPILWNDLVVLNNDQEKKNGNLLALDARTGEVKWTVDRRSERISYSVPCVYEVDGKPLLVFTNWQHGFTAIDPESGKVVAEKSVFFLETNERAISSPIVTNGLVIGTCGFTANPKHCVAMKMEKGEWQEVWRIERNVPHIPSVIAVGEYAYLIDDSGIGTCVKATTGEELWKKRIPGVEGAIFGSPVSDGENLFFVDESGNLHTLAASPEFKPIGVHPIGELCRTTPAIAGNTLYVRSETKLTAWR